jgi:hypothetical protein
VFLVLGSLYSRTAEKALILGNCLSVLRNLIH